MVAKRSQFFNQTSTTALCPHLLFLYLYEEFMLQLMIKTAYVCLLASLNKFPSVFGLEKQSILLAHCTVISNHDVHEVTVPAINPLHEKSGVLLNSLTDTGFNWQDISANKHSSNVHTGVVYRNVCMDTCRN